MADAVKVLRWLCVSDRPLQLLELVDVLAIETGDEGGFCPDERLPDPEDVISICSSLITYGVKTSGDEREDGYSNSSLTEADGDNIDALPQSGGKHRYDYEIRLAHFSVKEYLLSERCSLRSDFEI